MILSLIILFAAFSSFNVSLYFLVRSVRKKQSIYFSLGNLSLSYCLIVYTLEVNQLILDFPSLIWTNVPFLYAVGPLVYLDSIQKNTLKWNWLHFLPSILFTAFLFDFYTSSDANKIELFQSENAENEELNLFSYLYLLHWGIYYWMAFLKEKRQAIRQFKSVTPKSNIIKIWLEKYFAVISALSFFSCLILDYTNIYESGLNQYTLLLVILLLVLIHVILTLKFYGENGKKIPASYKFTKKNVPVPFFEEQFKKMLIAEKRYTDPNLSLNDLAADLACSSQELSAFINQHYQQSFKSLLSQLRIAEFKQQVEKSDFERFTLLAIAKNCGFSSNSTFHRIFKQIEGITPKEYLDKKA